MQKAEKVATMFGALRSNIALPSSTDRTSCTGQKGIIKANRLFDVPTLLFLLAAAVYLYGFVFVPPFIPILQNGDGLVYLSDAQRIWNGEVMYRDFFQFSTPGTALVDFTLFKIFGLHSWIPNLALLLLGLALAWLGVVVAKKVMRPSLTLFPSTIFLVGVYRNLPDATHHWYSLLTAMAAIAVLMDRRTPARIAAAGFFCGLTACFTQVRGVAIFVALSVFLWWESKRQGEGWRELLKRQGWPLSGFLTTIVAVNGYFVWKAGLARFLWCTVVFGLKYHHKQVDENSFWVITSDLPRFAWHFSIMFRIAAWLLIDVIVPFIPLLFFGYYWWQSGRKPREYWGRPMLLAVACFVMVLSVAPAPASIRTASCSLPGILLLVWFLDSPRKLCRAAVVIATAGILLLLPHGIARIQSVPRELFKTPRGLLAIEDSISQEQYRWILQHIHVSEYLYEMGGPWLYYYLNLRNPTPMPLLTNCGYTPPEQVVEAIGGLEQHRARYVLWSPSWAESIEPWEVPADNHLAPMREYVQDHYKMAKAFLNTEEIWERKD
jgi:hypothetical protein